ncbi:2-succinyl-6-hydroxy-2,4-cyclohexadiene-1-carboxylate synthase [Sporosarcina jiandibaonis]|uniref:2-succinyl-6-hydroxy-2, 4-cyclohexadiene-1-carboxylate synthase n=1 Tax=Sporosarcina jiandibaonis TaxID=2715535 RepID=UPI001FE42E77|nr:2-succinyl-6-hydroxy-2,4-cyclohexadiene-1-carboxylate synthase [Sporosarcina jiandibaonis]
MKLRKELMQLNEEIIPINGIDYYVRRSNDFTLPVIVFLHGFTGSAGTWSEITGLLKEKFHTIAIDLIGHGKTTAPRDPGRYSMEKQIADLETLFNELNIEKFILLGYSMGGRIALSYTIMYPKRVESLILESSTPGLKTNNERMERMSNDKLLAQRINSEGIRSFVEFWESIPLFYSQKKLSAEHQQRIRDERLSQNEVGLSNSLLGIGTGSQPSNWHRLKEINVPVLLITGEFDRKFIKIAQEMKKALHYSKHCSVKDAGHAIHVEKPTLFATMIEEHIQKIKMEEEKL